MRVGGRNADDVRVGATVVEKLLDRVAEKTPAIESAKLPLEFGEARNPRRTIGGASRCPPDEQRDRRRRVRDGADAAGYLLDVDTRICEGGWHQQLLRVECGVSCGTSFGETAPRDARKMTVPSGRL